eukprot:TRINITY_DN67728_c7_g2_i1.p1 TRINITY_DN67728_c7_g2~~TRINITY_DN67728_c7_g2_i1.p1  ORF type:complete len:527 (-),score=22.69 TRINITY_DN67728_c7_g2_i1:378-1958(-)
MFLLDVPIELLQEVSDFLQTNVLSHTCSSLWDSSLRLRHITLSSERSVEMPKFLNKDPSPYYDDEFDDYDDHCTQGGSIRYDPSGNNASLAGTLLKLKMLFPTYTANTTTLDTSNILQDLRHPFPFTRLEFLSCNISHESLTSTSVCGTIAASAWSLRRLHIDHILMWHLEPLLAALALTKKLEELRCGWLWAEGRKPKATGFSQALLGLPNLHTVSFRVLDGVATDVLVPLATLAPQLHTVEIGASLTSCAPLNRTLEQFGSPTSPVKSLTLATLSSDWAMKGHVFSYVPWKKLKKIDLFSWRGADTSIQTLADSFQPSTTELKSLRLYISNRSGSDAGQAAKLFFDKLQRCRALQSLCLQLDIPDVGKYVADYLSSSPLSLRSLWICFGANASLTSLHRALHLGTLLALNTAEFAIYTPVVTRGQPDQPTVCDVLNTTNEGPRVNVIEVQNQLWIDMACGKGKSSLWQFYQHTTASKHWSHFFLYNQPMGSGCKQGSMDSMFIDPTAKGPPIPWDLLGRQQANN